MIIKEKHMTKIDNFLKVKDFWWFYCYNAKEKDWFIFISSQSNLDK